MNRKTSSQELKANCNVFKSSIFANTLLSLLVALQTNIASAETKPQSEKLGPTPTSEFSPSTQDIELENKVNAAFKIDPNVSRFQLSVTVRNGVVTLEGIVGNETEKLQAIEAAEHIQGVKVVESKITLKP